MILTTTASNLDVDAEYSAESYITHSVTLSSDPRIKFVDSNNNGRWDRGETIVYDTNNNNVYDSGEPIIAGSTPTVGQALKTDPLIKYVDANGNNVWNAGETVVYDTTNN